MHEGSYLLDFLCDGGIGESIMVVSEFYELYDEFDEFGGIGVWLSMGAPRVHRVLDLNLAMHVHVLGEQVHCINHYGIVISWG
jgi:hypothetical protein